MLNEITWQFIGEHLSDDPRQLALRSSALRQEGIDWQEALRQIEGRRLIRQKLPEWYGCDRLLLPGRLPLEQSSSQATAQYKSSLLSGDTFADLTGGLGVDTAFISSRFNRSLYVERQQELADIARYNFELLGLSGVEVRCGDGIAALREVDHLDVLFLDPARRSAVGKKLVMLSDCEPDVSQVASLLVEKASKVLIKLSPMLDISLALQRLEYVTEVHLVSVENECKELLFILEKGDRKEPRIVAVNLKRQGDDRIVSFYPSEERQTDPVYAPKVEEYLYEPNTSLLKAGCFKRITRLFPVGKLHRNSHLYTSGELIPDFPGRIFRVEGFSGLSKSELKNLLEGVEQANLTVRNFPSSVEALRKKLKLKEGGGITLFATTLNDSRHLLIRGRRIDIRAADRS